jgi:hypothetical protein
MRNTHTCPKCSSRKLFVIGCVQQPHHGFESGSNTLVVHSRNIPTGRKTLGIPTTERVAAGYFEAWVCSICGFTEWYARQANEDLARMAQHPESGVLFIDGDAPASPYR